MDTLGLVGIDASLTCTGFAFLGQDGYHTGTIRPKSMRGPERLAYFRDTITNIIYEVAVHNNNKGVNLIILEDYAMGARGSRVFHMGELGGVIKLLAHDMQIRVLSVPPASLKLFVTGNGGSDKEAMAASVAGRLGYSITQEDEVDAFGLLKLGETYVVDRGRKSSRYRRALDGCSILD